MKRFGDYIVVGLIILVLALGILVLHGSAAPKLKTTVVGGCTESLWKHVYNPERLQIHNRCVTITGTIVDATAGKRKDGVRHEADGDCHGWLKLDAGQEKYLNTGNLSNEKGNLVFEIVCMFKVTQADAKQSCRGYSNKVRSARTFELLGLGSKTTIMPTGTRSTRSAALRW